MESLLNDPHINETTVNCIAAIIYTHEGEYEKALKAIKNPFTLEMFEERNKRSIRIVKLTEHSFFFF